MECAEGVGRDKSGRLANDRASDRMQRLRLLFDKVANRNIPFRHPRTLVKQSRACKKWREVHLDSLCAQSLQSPDCRVEKLCGIRIAEEFQLIMLRDAESAA